MVIKKCLYVHNAGVIQLEVHCQIPKSNTGTTPWKVLTDLPNDEHESAGNQTPILHNGIIYCALHPGIVMNDTLSSGLNQLKKRYIDGVDFVSSHSQFCLNRILIYCHLPNLYPSTKDSNHAESDLQGRTSWTVLDAILTLLQTHFHLCKDIKLVLRTDNLASSYRESNSVRDAVMAKLEKTLRRIDEFYEAIAPKGVDLAVYPSPAAFELYLAQEKKKAVEFHEGDWDSQRNGESRVWRRVELSRSEKKEMASSASSVAAEEHLQEGRGPGYWVKTDVVDWFEHGKMMFV